MEQAIIDPFAEVDLSQLERSLRRPRTLIDFSLNALVTAMTLACLVPLFLVVLMLAWRGGKRLRKWLMSKQKGRPGGGCPC